MSSSFLKINFLGSAYFSDGRLGAARHAFLCVIHVYIERGCQNSV